MSYEDTYRCACENGHDPKCPVHGPRVRARELEAEVERLRQRGAIALKLMTDAQRARFHRECDARAALASTVPSEPLVTDAMVDQACAAFEGRPDWRSYNASLVWPMRRALEVVLTGHAGGRDAGDDRRPEPPTVTLQMTDAEAEDAFSAFVVAVELLEQVEPGEGAVLTKASIPVLTQLARRLSHEQRHHGAVMNPNGPPSEEQSTPREIEQSIDAEPGYEGHGYWGSEEQPGGGG